MGSVCVGIDVSKERLEVALGSSGEVESVVNQESAIAELGKRLLALKPELVVMEASGGYERLVSVRLWEAGLPVVIANPYQVRQFAHGMGQHAKTDRIDARMIALWAEHRRPEVRTLPDQQSRALLELLSRRRQLMEMLVAERNRLEQVVTRQVRKEIARSIESLERRIKRLDDELDQQIRKSDLWRSTQELLRSVPGVGKLTALTLIAELPELGQLDRHHLASLVGLAPFPRDSGRFSGKRMIAGGRASVRSALYMAALSAARCNRVIAPFYRRLRERGKPPKVALTAVMRKLLTILNAMLKHHTPWSAPCPNHA